MHLQQITRTLQHSDAPVFQDDASSATQMARNPFCSLIFHRFRFIELAGTLIVKCIV